MFARSYINHVNTTVYILDLQYRYIAADTFMLNVFHCDKMKQLAVLAVLICIAQGKKLMHILLQWTSSKHSLAELISRCVTDGSGVQLQWPVEGDEFDYISWDILYDKNGNNIDYSQEEDTVSFNATWSGTGYDVLEVSCDDGDEQVFYALFIVTIVSNSCVQYKITDTIWY